MKRKSEQNQLHAQNLKGGFFCYTQVFSSRETSVKMQVILYPYRLVEYDDAENFDLTVENW
jgi:hypothetical protein